MSEGFDADSSRAEGLGLNFCKRTFIKKLHYVLLSFLTHREIDKIGMFV